MTVSRQDAWTADEDLILVELVLAHIRDGSTQLKAFEEAGKRLKRTAAACGFRWNSNLRKQYTEGIELAKKQRNMKKRRKDPIPEQLSDEDSKQLQTEQTLHFSDAVQFFRRLETELSIFEKVKKENELLKKEIAALKEEQARTNQFNKELNDQYQQLKEDYHTLMVLLDKARKMADDIPDHRKLTT